MPEPLSGSGSITASVDAAGASVSDVAVIGAGYVGLPLALHLAKAGLTVTAVDVDAGVVASISARVAKVEEKEDFERYFQDPAVQRNLRASISPVPANAYIIAVPTPVRYDDKTPDLRALVAAAESLVPYLRPGVLVVVESTVPPFATERLVAPILERSGLSAGTDFYLAHAPERILPGNIMAEAAENARVIGGINDASTAAAMRLVATYVTGALHPTNARTAEFIKLIENSYRDVNVAFANQVAVLGEALGIDPYKAIRLANAHPRVSILDPGIGVGGHCIPIDPWFLVHARPDDASLIKAARDLNDSMPRRTVAKIAAAVENVADARIVCLGATYKPNVRDLRESPALQVFELLRERGLRAELYDPLIHEYACDSVLSVARDADLLVILVPHDLIVTELQYRRAAILRAMRRPSILAFTGSL